MYREQTAETAEFRSVHLKIQTSIANKKKKEKIKPSTISHVCFHTNWRIIVFGIGKRRDENIFVI